ncbi:P-loop containing nucleoside triphosphate hydrolase protein [Lentinula edodes]|nr:P-loop containing nucleoside triphosphate hydrolase protein [Lentinula edodes]
MIPPSTSLLLVSSDIAVRQPFQRSLKIVHATKPVACFIYDEGQLAVTDSTYRDPLRDACEVRCLPVPMIVLSGSAPPNCIPVMANTFGLASPYIQIRNCTDRPELEYILEQERPKFQIKARLIELVAAARNKLQPHERILIFVQKVDYGSELASAFKCGFYSGDKNTTPNRQKTYQDWVDGLYNILIGTSALLAGNDYLHVRFVFFAGTPPDATGFAQGAGRGGRDHLPCPVTILPHKGAYIFSSNQKDDYAGCVHMAALCKNTPPLCIRWNITRFMDGHGILCKDSGPNAQLCSNCRTESGSLNTVTSYISPTDMLSLCGDHVDQQPNLAAAVEAAQYHRHMRTAGSDPVIASFEKGFNIFNGNCTYCGATEGVDSSHTLPQCPNLDFSKVRSFRRLIKYSSCSEHEKRTYGTVCYSCHIPQLPGDAVHGPYGRSVRCEHIDFMMGLVFRIQDTPDVFTLAKQEFNINKEDLGFWLALRPQSTVAQPSLSYYVSNFARLVCWYIDKYL